MLKIRRPLGRLIFNMGIAIPGKTVFLIETAPRWLDTRIPFLPPELLVFYGSYCDTIQLMTPWHWDLTGLLWGVSTVDFPHKGSSMRRLVVFVLVRLNEPLNKELLVIWYAMTLISHRCNASSLAPSWSMSRWINTLVSFSIYMVDCGPYPTLAREFHGFRE